MENISKKENLKVVTTKVKSFDLEKVSDRFSKVKCYVLYTGLNRNGSYITREASDKAAEETLSYTPVVAHIKYDKENNHYYIGAHDYSDTITETGGYNLCIPYGVVVDNSYSYEDIQEDDGSVHTYLTCDVYLWTGEYPEITQCFYDDKKLCAQSMEIRVIAAQPSQEYKNCTVINEFEFRRLTMLGYDPDNAEYNTEPCFESSGIYDYSCDNFSLEFNKMKDELKLTFNNKDNIIKEESILNIDKFNEIISKYNIDAGNFSMKYEDCKDMAVEDFEAKVKEYSKQKNDDKKDKKFTLTVGQMFDEFRQQCEKQGTFTDEYGYEEHKYWLRDVSEDDAFAIVMSVEDNCNLYGVPYFKNNDFYTLDFGSKQRVKCSYSYMEGEPDTSILINPMAEFVKGKNKEIIKYKKSSEEYSANYNELETKFTDITKQCEEYSKAKEEAEKREYKNKKDKIFEKFDSKLNGNKEYTTLKGKEDISLSDLETECYALVGKTEFSYKPSHNNNENYESVKFGVNGSIINDESDLPSYANLFSNK